MQYRPQRQVSDRPAIGGQVVASLDAERGAYPCQRILAFPDRHLESHLVGERDAGQRELRVNRTQRVDRDQASIRSNALHEKRI